MSGLAVASSPLTRPPSAPDVGELPPLSLPIIRVLGDFSRFCMPKLRVESKLPVMPLSISNLTAWAMGLMLAINTAHTHASFVGVNLFLLCIACLQILVWFFSAIAKTAQLFRFKSFGVNATLGTCQPVRVF